jgi:hypothetical protein
MNEAKRQNDTGLLEVLTVVREELDEVEEKGEDIEKQQAKKNEKAGIGAVVSARKDTLKPPCALPLRSKSDTHN